MRAAIPVAFIFIVGCAGGDFGAPAPENNLGADAGDGGFFDAPQAAELAAICDELVARTCTLDGELACEEEPGCVAAQVLAEFAPDRCADGLDNPSFPACVASACETLVLRACGAGDPGLCEDSVGCAPSRTLLERAVGEDEAARESAERSCNDALQDDVFFPACE
jgi:hypothetical protein